MSEIEHSLVSIEKETGERIDLNSIPLDDPEVYDIFCEGGTDGIFQFSGRGIKEMLIKAMPRTFEELMAIFAMNRKSMECVFEDYVRNKNNPERITFLHPCLDPILSETHGILIYQEQIIRVASAVGGFATSQAESFRRMLFRKESPEADSFKNLFIASAIERGVEDTTAQSILSMIFCKSIPSLKAHCVSYTMIAYWQAWLKHNH